MSPYSLVETLPRRGYRFIASIESADPRTRTQSADAAAHPASRMKNSVRALAEDGFWIAVLPFKLTDADADLADCAMALIEEIVTGLSRFSYLRVISLSSTSQYAGESVDVRAAGRELGARYVLEGSLRHAGPRVRVGAQQVDCNSGAHLWPKRMIGPFPLRLCLICVMTSFRGLCQPSRTLMAFYRAA